MRVTVEGDLEAVEFLLGKESTSGYPQTIELVGGKMHVECCTIDVGPYSDTVSISGYIVPDLSRRSKKVLERL